MDIILSSDRIDVQECDTVVTGFFVDERPLRGASGWVDWRLNGRVSRLIREERITGEWKETILVPSEGRLAAPLILLVGLGKMREYRSLRLRELVPHLVMTFRGIQAPNICLSFPCGEPYTLECGTIAEVLVEGIAGGLDSDSRLKDEEWVKNLRLFFTHDTGQFGRVFLGIQAVKALLEERFGVRVLVPSENPDPLEGRHKPLDSTA